jgi:tetratricopeptide (TPR) repeat protein
MESNSQDIQLIDRFLLNELSHAELAAFNKRLEADPGLAQLLKEEKKLRKGIEYSSLKQMAQTLVLLEASLTDGERNPPARTIHTHWWSTTGFKLAASILLLVSASAVIYYFLRENSHPDPRLAFENHFTPFPNDFFPIKRGGEVPASLIDSAFLQYDAGNFGDALMLFERIPVLQRDEVIQFYIANAALATGNPEQAQPILKVLAQNKESVVHIPARWYLALCYLKTNNPGDARVVLNELKASNNSYQQKAIGLLEEISE